MRRTLASRLRALATAVAQLLCAAVALVLAVLWLVGLALVVIAWGLPLVLAAAVLAGRLADAQRRFAGRFLGRPVVARYRPYAGTGPLARVRVVLFDGARWRDLLWLLVQGTAGLAVAVLALLEAVVDLLLWWLPPALALHALAWVAGGLLGSSERSRLNRRVEQLATSRADTVASQSAEIRRIERDLHDGAQARLIALGMSLSLAESQLDSDPAAARALIAEARVSGGAALVELRGLVRGILPPVLADRGLAGAVEALALQAPLSVTTTAELGGRLPEAVESASYFAVAEALTNAIKHSGAAHADVALVHRGDALHVAVRDDGHGGARVTAGGGLRGIERRLAAFDGTLTVESPPGGPTVLLMVLPCASSSPKTSPSSGTA